MKHVRCPMPFRTHWLQTTQICISTIIFISFVSLLLSSLPPSSQWLPVSPSHWHKPDICISTQQSLGRIGSYFSHLFETFDTTASRPFSLRDRSICLHMRVHACISVRLSLSACLCFFSYRLIMGDEGGWPQHLKIKSLFSQASTIDRHV